MKPLQCNLFPEKIMKERRLTENRNNRENKTLKKSKKYLKNSKKIYTREKEFSLKCRIQIY